MVVMNIVVVVGLLLSRETMGCAPTVCQTGCCSACSDYTVRSLRHILWYSGSMWRSSHVAQRLFLPSASCADSSIFSYNIHHWKRSSLPNQRILFNLHGKNIPSIVPCTCIFRLMRPPWFSSPPGSNRRPYALVSGRIRPRGVVYLKQRVHYLVTNTEGTGDRLLVT